MFFSSWQSFLEKVVIDWNIDHSSLSTNISSIFGKHDDPIGIDTAKDQWKTAS